MDKIIHYCWFGNKSFDQLTIRCIDSWKRFLPDYKIKLWNEDNFDIHSCKYVEEAYKKKKWAFVSDYARFDILYKYGGLYFDTDVEIIKPIDDIIELGPFFACENQYGENFINPGLGMYASQGLTIYKEIIDDYRKSDFINENKSGDYLTVVKRVTSIFKRHGYINSNTIQKIDDISIYPPDYFCPLNFEFGKLNTTERTRTIHHFAASWMPYEVLISKNIRAKLVSKFGKKGLYISRIINMPLYLIHHLKSKGFFGTLKYIINKKNEK